MSLPKPASLFILTKTTTYKGHNQYSLIDYGPFKSNATLFRRKGRNIYVNFRCVLDSPILGT